MYLDIPNASKSLGKYRPFNDSDVGIVMLLAFNQDAKEKPWRWSQTYTWTQKEQIQVTCLPLYWYFNSYVISYYNSSAT